MGRRTRPEGGVMSELNYKRPFKVLRDDEGFAVYDNDGTEVSDDALEALLNRSLTAWVPVTERLPNSNKRVLFAARLFSPNHYSIFIGHCFSMGDPEYSYLHKEMPPEWVCDDESLCANVEYWMPLPAPPAVQDAVSRIGVKT